MHLMTAEEYLAYLERYDIEGGAAFDLDETITETNEYWFEALVTRFGNHERLTSEQVIIKYVYYQHYWNTPEAHAFMNEMAASEELTLSLRPVDGAHAAVHAITRKVKAWCYITARPHAAARSSLAWLAKHGFPSAPLITRPEHIALHHGSRWKAGVLRRLYPRIRHVFDDSVALLDHLGEDYGGRLYALKVRDVTHPSIDVRPCPTWREAQGHFDS